MTSDSCSSADSLGLTIAARAAPRGGAVGITGGGRQVVDRPGEAVDAQARPQVQARGRHHVGLGVDPDGADAVAAVVTRAGVGAEAGGQVTSGFGVAQAGGDGVEPELGAGAEQRLGGPDGHRPLVAGAGADEHAVVALADLVAVNGVACVQGEVGEQVELVSHAVAVHAPGRARLVVADLVAGGDRRAHGGATLGRVDRAETRQPAGRDLSRRQLARLVPAAVVPGAGHAEPSRADLAAPPPQRVALAEVLRVKERPIVLGDLHRQQAAVLVVAAQARAGHRHQAAVLVAVPGVGLADRGGAGDPHGRAVDLIEGGQLDGAGGVVVAVACGVRALVDGDRGDRLGDQEVRVGVALAVPVRGQVDRHAVGEDGDVGAVVGVEAADEVLVGLATAGVLRHHQAGYLPQQVRRLRARPGPEPAGVEVHRRRRLGRGVAGDGDGLVGGGQRQQVLVGQAAQRGRGRQRRRRRGRAGWRGGGGDVQRGDRGGEVMEQIGEQHEASSSSGDEREGGHGRGAARLAWPGGSEWTRRVRPAGHARRRWARWRR
jgi:hypothetical protein